MTKIKRGDRIKLRVTHGVEDVKVVVASIRGTNAMKLDRPDGHRITGWLWDDGIAHLSPQPACSDCGKLFHSERAIDSHRHACPKKGMAAAKVAVAPSPPTMPRIDSEIRWMQQSQESEIKRLEQALGEPIEAAERGPHRSFCMRGPGDMAGDWYLFIGALWDPREGLQVILRRNQDKLCRTVHFSWLLPKEK